MRGQTPRTNELVAALSAVTRGIDPEFPVYGVIPMTQFVERLTGTRRLGALFFSMFSGLALVLAALGVYAVLANNVTREYRNIGIRMALGASPARILGLVAGRSASLIAGGILLGLAGGAAVARFLSSMLYEVRPHDARIFTSVGVLLAVVALTATWLAVQGAVRMNPAAAIRDS